MHCELRIGDSMLLVGGGAPAAGRERTHNLHIYVADADAVFQKALEAGAQSVDPVSDRPYGERLGAVKDGAGNLWYIATARRPLPPVMRTGTPYVHAQNPFGLIDFLKTAFNASEIGIEIRMGG